MRIAKQIMLSVSAVVLLFTAASSMVMAQTNEESGSGLSISPTRTELSIEPGEADVIKLSLRNVTSNDIVAKAFINDFESDGETGEPKILPESNSQDAPSIRPFLIGVTDVSLKSGERKSFDIPVQIPEDAAPGAYFGIIRYAAVPVNNQDPEAGEVSLTASVGSIVLIEVPGEIRQQVQARDVLFYRKGVAATIFTVKPEEIGVRVGNQGNGFVKPFGSVVVIDPLGKEVHQYELNSTDPRSNVLPNSTRVFRDPINGVSKPGRYKVTANASFGNGGEVLTVQRAFWYLPWWFIVSVLALIAIISWIIFRVKKRLNGRRPKRARL